MHKVKAGQCMSETTTFSKLLELEVSDKEWQEKQWEGSHAVERDLNSLGSAELLKSVNRRVTGSHLSFRKIKLMDFGLQNDKTKGKKTS